MAISKNKLQHLSPHVYFISTPTNIGVIAMSQPDSTTSIYLIDSGNDQSSAEELWDFIQEEFQKPHLKAIINTHSHADHCGGNSYLMEKTGCQIWASKGEASLMEYPEIETGLIWGGTPITPIRSSYLMAPPCKTDRIFDGEETISLPEDDSIKIKVIALPGHYLDQTGFLVTDSDGKTSLFMGDAISGRNVIRKYWIQYLYDETRTKESLVKLSKIKADFYIPGHGQLVDNIEGLSELNLIAMMETEDMILDELKTYKTTEEILKAVADRNQIRLGLANYVLIGSTLRSYLSGLYEEKKIDFQIQENRLLWIKR